MCFLYPMKGIVMKKIVLTCIALLLGFSSIPAEPLPLVNPWDVGLDYQYVNEAFQSVSAAITEGAAPGAVGLVLKDGKIAALRALGQLQTDWMYRSAIDEKMQRIPMKTKMIEDALFDLASLTKMVATTTSVMMLIEQDQIQLDEPVQTYIPSFGQRGKEKVTVRHLLTHSSGLSSWVPFYELYINPEEIYRAIDEEIALDAPPGETRVYSDLGFIILGRLVEVVSGERLDHFAQTHIFEPLGMTETTYLPRLKARLYTAPTEYDPARNRILQGIVHDENCRALGGVSGHAGLFSTARDLAIYAQMLLNGGEWNGVRILKPETIQTMLTPQLTSEAQRNGSSFLRLRNQLLGWWGMDEEATITGLGGLPSKTAYGHQGFTGPLLYIDPEHNCAALFLTNAVHPKREEAQKTTLYRAFFGNISKAIVGADQVKIQEK